MKMPVVFTVVPLGLMSVQLVEACGPWPAHPFELTKIMWINLLWLPLVVGCRMAKFVREEGVALENHVITTLTADHPIKCEWDCVDMPMCFSINVHAQKLPSGWVTCDLNNSSRKNAPQDLVVKTGYRYHEMAEVPRCTVDHCIYKAAPPDDWFIYNSKKFKIFPERKTWGRARKYCQAIGGELVSIDSNYKNKFITHLFDRFITNATAGDSSSQIIAHWTLDGTDSDVNLMNGATYKEEDGIQSLYLNGSGAYATTPAVNFGRESFTITSWVKLQSPIKRPSPIYSDWSYPIQFLVSAYDIGEKWLFGGANNIGEYKPWLFAGHAPVDKWFHMAAAWDQHTNEAYLFVDGQKVGTQAQANGSFLRENSKTVYDIGLKKDNRKTLRGYLKDLMIIGKALTQEELANVTDPNKDPFGGVWIGLNDITKEGQFLWADGSHVTYANWASSQPDNRKDYENCVEIAVHGGSWKDTSCGRQLPFICEKQN